MTDELVKRAQQFINQYNVPGIPKVAEDGNTGWSTMLALTRVLQYELNIGTLSDNFGPTTLATLQSRFPLINESCRVAAIIRVLQSALYCKGYDGGEIDGTYNARVSVSVTLLKQHMGISDAFPESGVTPKVFKCLLNLDPYVLTPGGRNPIRSIQQWMNARYISRKSFFIIPCDGHFSRDVQKALMLAIQFEIGMNDEQANGVFGPATQAGLRTKVLSVGSSGPWVQLFSAAMVFNQRNGTSFTRTYDASLAAQVRAFQKFSKLPVTGKGNFQTWASLLVSTGDSSRRGKACDCVTEITAPRSRALKKAGYRVVARYLCNVDGTNLDKKIQPGELAVIAKSGLRVVPIYQTWGGSAHYFNREKGTSDGLAAIYWARSYGFTTGTRIYFAVDYDALDSDVTSNIIPHFRGIKSAMDEYGQEYKMGIYGPRNVCSRVASEGLTSASFVADMSSGFSGNLGYPLPSDWAFDQIATVTVGNGAGKTEIDNNILSGRDTGQNSFKPVPVAMGLDVDFDLALRDALLADIQKHLQDKGIPETGGGVAQDVLQPNSTTDAFNVVMAYDTLFTGIARTLKIRKALIMCPVLWEIRKFTSLDLLADQGVITYHTGTDWDPTDKFVKRDSSTGLGQIFAVTAINARNYAIRLGIINGKIMDPESDADIWDIWQKLHSDDSFNINTAAQVLIQGASDIGIAPPSLDYSDENSRLVLKRYQGFGDAAESDSKIKLGLYQTFEKHFAPLRN